MYSINHMGILCDLPLVPCYLSLANRKTNKNKQVEILHILLTNPILGIVKKDMNVKNFNF